MSDGFLQLKVLQSGNTSLNGKHLMENKFAISTVNKQAAINKSKIHSNQRDVHL